MERTGQSLLCPELIGRTSELAALTSLVEQAREGNGRLTLIAGEAGIESCQVLHFKYRRARNLRLSRLGRKHHLARLYKCSSCGSLRRLGRR